MERLTVLHVARYLDRYSTVVLVSLHIFLSMDGFLARVSAYSVWVHCERKDQQYSEAPVRSTPNLSLVRLHIYLV